MTQHAKLSASGSHRWLNCLGSVEAEAPFKDTTSAAAQEGTCAHELAELVLIEGGSCQAWVGKPLIENNQYTVEQEMADYIQEYVDFVKTLPGEQHYEIRVDFSDWVPEGFGTSDVISIDNETIYICDLKYGKGLQVNAEENSQGMLYALGAFAEYELVHDIKEVVIIIHQPRLDHVSEWRISVQELLKWGAWVSEQCAIIEEGDAPRTPGEKQCQWCKGKATCQALKSYTEKIIMAEFEELDSPDPTTLNQEQLRNALKAKKLIESWLSAVEGHVKELLEKGEEFEGFKLVEGRSIRKWADEDVAAEQLENLLEDRAYEKRLITPAKADKVLGKSKKGEIAGYIVKPQGAPTLVPESDKRQAINISEKDFDSFE
jgi:hypothetical protein